jgi:hypothetical protein
VWHSSLEIGPQVRTTFADEPDFRWKPETELVVVPVEDQVSSHALIGGGATVRVIAHGESWPVREVKSALKDG